ncbi:hypothetical protein [Solidesulfovibrio sp.]
METRQVGVRFTGGVLASLGYSLLFIMLFLLLLPGAWGAAALAAWWTANLAFDDGTRAEFEGRPGQIWVIVAALALVAYLPAIATLGLPQGNKATLLQLVLSLVLLPLDAALKLPFYRWFIENIRLTPGGRPRFTATYLGYLGWVSLVGVSILTVIGWAWATTAMLRWFCRHIESEAYVVDFAGTGWGLLWRSFLWLIGMVCIIPIPWVFRSIYAWGANNLVLTRAVADAAANDRPEFTLA